MPTGYTAKLMTEGQSFDEFVLTCARAMGACVMLRDDDLGPVTLDRIQSCEGNYYAETFEEAQATHESLQSMDEEAQLKFGAAQREETMTRYSMLIEGAKEQNARLAEMTKRVEAWEPPTPDHEGLKEFMIGQLRQSHETVDYYERSLKEWRDRTPLEVYRECLADAYESLEWKRNALREATERNRARVEWTRQLIESVK